ncbi:hypothetical protein CBR_g6548 [Chara braunii]|uniref:CCHC-type domain-containing protein n=1 Tax=Chara braunii TaxID=69332 RepID=A0A388KK38_CHABU|nr:hypothetical protein CBR_g6548 [Chara braunii]|eukprot:GBG70422.1 hypothetical protein CBR_g6548 [Chara braunii]
MSGFIPTCYACGVVGHIRGECPNRGHGGYGGAMQPAQPLLALPAPPSVPQQVQYSQPSKVNWYPRMGERVDKIETIIERLKKRAREQQENDEKAKKQREEKEARKIRRKEREELEEAMGERMEKCFKKMNNAFFGKKQGEEMSELDKLKKKVEELETAVATSKKSFEMGGDHELRGRNGDEGKTRVGETLRTPELRAMYQVTMKEMDVLKQKRAEAQAEVIRMKEKVDQQARVGMMAHTPVRNLRTRMEEAAEKQNDRSVRKSKQKASPGRVTSAAKEVHE